MNQRQLSYDQAAIRSAEQLLTALETRPTGLTPEERAARSRQCGRNETVAARKTIRAILLRQLRSPFIYLLAAAALISALTGDGIEGGMILLFMAINTALGFFQEYRAEQAAKLLLRYWRQNVRLLQNGTETTLDSRDLLPGDVIRLAAGDRIPADVRFLTTYDLRVDESILTGESVPIAKTADALAAAPGELYQAANIGFSGTSLTAGRAEAVVFATGREAALGQLIRLANETHAASTFEKEIAAMSGVILKLVLATLAFIFVLNLGLKGVSRVEELLIFAIALTVGIIPEALPIISTIALSRGAAALIRRQVIVKRLSAINDLGSIDILCTDKTGTITKNVMEIADVRAADRAACLAYALAGASAGPGARSADPFDHALARSLPDRTAPPFDPAHDLTAAERLAEEPFDPVRRRNTVIVRTAAGAATLITRGAPETIIPLCRDGLDQLALGRYLEKQGLAGNRVLAIAIKEVERWRDGKMESDSFDLLKEEREGLTLVGLIAFHDPLKEDAVAAAQKARQLGVQIKVLTGDSKEVAGAVAVKMGLIADPYAVVSGAEFEAMDDRAKHDALERYQVFARLNPAQKFAILGMLQEHNSVGFLGEGFNDAPGLKMANVGLAVDGASDVARESADVILLNKSLLVIFDGIEEGRRVFTNIIKYLKLTLASNFGNFYSIAIVSLFIDFLPMLPAQILFVNLLSDLPMFALAADRVPVEDLKKPKHYNAREVVFAATVLGIVSSVFDFITFALFRHLGAARLQTLWFMESALEELAFLFAVRTTGPFHRGPRPAPLLAGLAGVSALAIILVPFTALGAKLFRFSRPEPMQLVLVLAIVLTCFAATELAKRWLRRAPRTPLKNNARS